MGKAHSRTGTFLQRLAIILLPIAMAMLVMPLSAFAQDPQMAEADQNSQASQSDKDIVAAGITVQADASEVEGVPDTSQYYCDGYFTGGVTGTTSEGATPKVYYKYHEATEDEIVFVDDGGPEPVQQVIEGQPAYITIYNAEEGITSITIPTTVKIGEESVVVKEIREDAFWHSHETLANVDFHDDTQLETLTGFCQSQISTIAIPASVTTLGASAFDGCENLEDVSFSPSSELETIEYHAFDECKKLESIELPNGLQTIGSSAFSICYGLAHITIPSSVTTIGDDAFAGSGLVEFSFTADHECTIGRSVFDCCNSLATVSIDAPAVIADYAFDYCKALNTVTLKRVTSLGDGTFRDCSALETVDLPDSISSLGSLVFEDCSSLTHVTLPANEAITTIPASMFLRCRELVSCTVPDTVTITRIEHDAFCWCVSLEEAPLHEGLQFIGETAFGLCYSLQSVTLPSSVTEIEENAFYDCVALTTADFSQATGLTSIPDECFWGDEVLETVMLPANVTSIGKGAFENDPALKSIEIPAGVTAIGDYAFEDCASLAEIELPAGLQSIGKYAFEGCENLASIDIPDSVSELGESIFSECTALTEATLPDNEAITAVPRYLFSGCTSLTQSVFETMPARITSFGDGAFEGCAFTSIIIPADVMMLGERVFRNSATLTTVRFAEGSRLASINGTFAGCTALNIDIFEHLPETVVYIGDDSFSDCAAFAGELVIPDTVGRIGCYAFARCDGITAVKLPANLAAIVPEDKTEGDWEYSRGIFMGCENLKAVTWPTGAGFDAIAPGMFDRCENLADPSVIASIPESVATICEDAFSRTAIQVIDIPDTVDVIESGAFNIATLQSLEWPQNNGDFDTFHGGFDAVENSDVVNAVFSSLPASVKTIPEYTCWRTDNITKLDLSLTGIETIGDYAFAYCEGIGEVTFPATLRSIGSHAFASLGDNASGIEIIVPASVTHIGLDAFSNVFYTYSYSTGTETKHYYPATLHILNPDFVFEEQTGYFGTEIDGISYDVPFSYGQTIYSSATNSRGSESFIHKWSQTETTYRDADDNEQTCKVEDLGRYVQDSDGVPAYTFVWVQPKATVSGTVPAGASLIMTQGTGPSRVITNVNVSPTGAFTADAVAARSTMLRVSLDGYYDYTISRSASAMANGWNDVLVTTDMMEKIPAKSYLTLNLRKRFAPRGEGEEATYVNLASNENFDYALVDADGNPVAFTTAGTILNITANSDDGDGNDIAADAELTLTATPKASAAKAYKVGPVTVTSTLAASEFMSDLPDWGSTTIKVNSADSDSYNGNMRVMVFEGNNRILIGDCMAGETFATGQLAAGTYTVVAINDSTTFRVSSLSGIESMGLDAYVAREEFTVEDSKATTATLSVPYLDTKDLMAENGLADAALTLTSKRLVVGGEQTAIIDYGLDTTKATGVEFRLVVPKGTNITSCGSSESIDGESKGRVGYDLVASGGDTDTYSITLSNASHGKLYVKYVANVGGICTVGLSAVIRGVSIPISSNTYSCDALDMKASEEILTTSKGSAVIYAPPKEEVTFTVTSGNSETTIPTFTTGASCHRTVSFELPDTPPLPGQRYTLKASIGEKGKDSYREIEKTVMFAPGAGVADFTITNGGTKYPLIKDYEKQREGLSILYHIKDKKYAYWGFSMTLNTYAYPDVDDSFMLYVDTMGGKFVQIPMKKSKTTTNARGERLVTFTGQFVDEVWLEAYQWAVDNNESGVWTFDWDKVFVPETISYPNNLLTSLVTFDTEEVEKQKEEQALKRYNEEQARYQKLIIEFRRSFQEEGDAYEAVKDYDELMDEVVKSLNEAIIAAGGTEDDLLSSQPDNTLYFTEGGLNGVNLDDLLFDDEYADPYYDPDDPDFDPFADEFLDEHGNAITENPPGLDNFGQLMQIIGKMKADLDRAIAAADRTEAELAKSMGAKKNDLSEYSSWNGVTADILEGSGADITDLANEGTGAAPTPPSHPFGDTGAKVDKKENNSGFVATDDKNVHEDVTFSEQSCTFAEKLLYKLSALGSNSQAGDSYSTFTAFAGELYNLSKEEKSAVAWLLAKSPTAKSYLESTFRAMDRTVVRGITVGKALNYGGGVVGAGLGLAGVSSATLAYTDAKALWESTKDDTESIDRLIEFWSGKDDCDNKEACLQALRAERIACEEYCELLQSRYRHLAVDVGATATCAFVGMVGSICSAGTAGAASAAAGAVYNAGSAAVHADRDLDIEESKANYKNKQAIRRKVCKGCKCDPNKNPDCDPDPDPDPENDGDNGMVDHWPNNYLDPSGVVYEAVLSNPIEGAEVTVYRSDNADGSGAVASEDFVATGQANPQTTNADGVFQWDVTTGYYQVVVSDGNGYTGAQSAWLPVTPPQLDVNLGVVSTLAPEVASVVAYTDYIEVIFSQWMQTGAVNVTGIEGARCEWAAAEQSGDETDGEDVTYSRTLHIFKNGNGFAVGSTVRFTLAANGVMSYNGKTLEGAFDSGPLTVTQRPAAIVLNIEGDEEGKATQLVEQIEAVDDIDAYVVDGHGKPLANLSVTATCGSADLAGIASVADANSAAATTDAAGKASFTLTTHDAPGLTGLTFTVDGTSLSRTIDLQVESAQVRPNRPVVTIVSGDEVTTIDASSPKSSTVKVAAGAQLTITADEGDIVYYTTNDTCPCTEGGRVQYSGPITLNEDTYFRIAAYNGDYDPSKGGYSSYSRRLNITVDVEVTSPVKPAEHAAQGKAYKVGDFYYKVTNAVTNGTGTVTLVKPVKKTLKSVSVASSVNILGAHYLVTGIGAKAFYKCKKLVTVKGGALVENIDKKAFAACAKLKKFTITSKTLKTIGARAFSGDKSLKVVNIPNTTKLKTVKGSLKGSKVKKANVKNSKAKKYRKLFKKSGKSVTVK